MMDHDYRPHIAERIEVEDRANSILCSASTIADDCSFYLWSDWIASLFSISELTTEIEAQKVFWCNPWVGAGDWALLEGWWQVRTFRILITIPFPPVCFLFSRPSPSGGGRLYVLEFSLVRNQSGSLGATPFLPYLFLSSRSATLSVDIFQLTPLAMKDKYVLLNL
jgi:hypothetical protein